MTVFRTRDIESALTSKGFKQANSDHKYYFFYVDGKKTSIRTKISHGASEYGDVLLGLMKKQLHLEKKELEELINCTLGEKEYRELLAKKNVLQI